MNLTSHHKGEIRIFEPELRKNIDIVETGPDETGHIVLLKNPNQVFFVRAGVAFRRFRQNVEK